MRNKALSEQEILQKVPSVWGQRHFTDAERIFLWNGGVIFSGERFPGRRGHSFRMYYILYYDSNVDEYRILHRVDHPVIRHLGVRPFRG